VTGADDIVENLRQVEERLRELAYERLRDAAANGDTKAEADERKLQQAHRAVQRAIHALGGSVDDWAGT
jgi:hypothetical protein